MQPSVFRPLPARGAACLAWLLAALSLLSLLGVRPALADEVTGTWTGGVDVPRGNYYWERSTRVIAPAVQGRIESPRGVRVDAGYLIDAITSASQATGVTSDVAFTEVRHDGNLGVGGRIDLGERSLDLSVRGRVSVEPDYFSRGAGFSLGLEFNRRNDRITLSGYYLNDDVGRVVRGASPDDPQALIRTRRQHVGTLNALSLGLSHEHILTRTMLLISGVDFAYLSGYQENPYRPVVPAGGGPPSNENVPDLRLRPAAYLRFKKRFVRTRSTLALGYRIYRDTWKVFSHAPEIRWYQDLGAHMMIRLRYRYYTQSAAYFYVPGGPPRDAKLRTADPKLSEFSDHTFGLMALCDLGFLRDSKLAFLADARLDFGLAFLLSSNRFGDGVLGRAGMHFPF